MRIQNIGDAKKPSKVDQSSINLLQLWRENCDIQIILYENDPNVVEPLKILQITNYIVTYSCKEYQYLKDEQDQIKTRIMKDVQILDKCCSELIVPIEKSFIKKK